jgi:hypothetical protein
MTIMCKQCRIWALRSRNIEFRLVLLQIGDFGKKRLIPLDFEVKIEFF